MNSSTRRLVRIAAVTLGALAPASGALAAQASAATITVDKACYVTTDSGTGAPMTVTGSGFGAGDPILITGRGMRDDNVTADPSGNFTTTAQAPLLSTSGPGSTATTITAADQNSPASSATAVVHSANLTASVTPVSVRNVRTDKVTYRFSGFTPGKPIFAFYIVHHRVVAHVRFGRTHGPCGVLRQRALLYPGGRPAKSQYTVTFESVSRYSRTAFPHVTATLKLLHF